MAVYLVRSPLMIRCSLSSTLPLVKHILQDVNRKAQNRTCKQPLTVNCIHQSENLTVGMSLSFLLGLALCGTHENREAFQYKMFCASASSLGCVIYGFRKI